MGECAAGRGMLPVACCLLPVSNKCKAPKTATLCINCVEKRQRASRRVQLERQRCQGQLEPTVCQDNLLAWLPAWLAGWLADCLAAWPHPLRANATNYCHQFLDAKLEEWHLLKRGCSEGQRAAFHARMQPDVIVHIALHCRRPAGWLAGWLTDWLNVDYSVPSRSDTFSGWLLGNDGQREQQVAIGRTLKLALS